MMIFDYVFFYHFLYAKDYFFYTSFGKSFLTKYLKMDEMSFHNVLH